MANNHPQLLDKLTPEFQGAIWFGEGPLDYNLAGFAELNYLFDGLLSQAVNHYTLDEKKTPLSFFTQNFGNNFFLHYFEEITTFPTAILNQHDDIRKKILIINSNHNLKLQSEDFAKYFPRLQFEVLDLI